MGPLEQGTIQFDGIGIRHNSNCDYGIGHKHYFGLCLIPPTPNELCLIPTYSVSFVPNSIHTIGPYSVCPSTVTPPYLANRYQQFTHLNYRLFNFRILCLSHLAYCLGVTVIKTNLKTNHRYRVVNIRIWVSHKWAYCHGVT